MDISEDDLILVTSAAILYACMVYDTSIVEALTRLATAMAEKGEIQVTRCHGRLDPNVHARMRLAEEMMEAMIGG